MMRIPSILGLALVLLVAGSAGLVGGSLSEDQAPPPPAPNPAAKNPHLGNPQSIRSGMTLYRIRCGDCHGLDATGYRGP